MCTYLNTYLIRRNVMQSVCVACSFDPLYHTAKEMALRIYTNYPQRISGTSKRTTNAQVGSMTLIINIGVTAIRLRSFMLLLHKNSIRFIHTLLHYMFIEVLKSMYGCIILKLISSHR